jgi:hypothetical protein
MARRFGWHGVPLCDSIHKTMKRWAVLTVLLYAFTLLLLTVPVLLIAFGNWGLNSNNNGLHGMLQIYLAWGYWLWLAIMVAGQALLLLLPINIAERRLPARRPLKMPVIVSAFFLANLCFAGIFSILCAIFTDQAFNYFDLFALFTTGTNQNGQSTGNNSGPWGTLFTMILTVVVFWIIWAFIFRRSTKADSPEALLTRATRWLLRGSILELLIAVPSHVIVRRRDDCCAPAGTFWGIATGISVMLLCFGPGVFFLFVERFRRLQPRSPEAKKPS